MKVLRISTYHPATLLPLTAVMRESDTKIPLSEVAREMEVPGSFTVADIFDYPPGLPPLIMEATHAAFLRLQDSARFTDEKNMALSYYWNADRLRMVVPGGTIANPKPAPLRAEQLKVVIRQLRRHPNYDRQRIVMASEDGYLVACDPEGNVTCSST